MILLKPGSIFKKVTCAECSHVIVIENVSEIEAEIRHYDDDRYSSDVKHCWINCPKCNNVITIESSSSVCCHFENNCPNIKR